MNAIDMGNNVEIELKQTLVYLFSQPNIRIKWLFSNKFQLNGRKIIVSVRKLG